MERPTSMGRGNRIPPRVDKETRGDALPEMAPRDQLMSKRIKSISVQRINTIRVPANKGTYRQIKLRKLIIQAASRSLVEANTWPRPGVNKATGAEIKPGGRSRSPRSPENTGMQSSLGRYETDKLEG
ncbi:hypothetical protein Bbelb_267650 [Branchiostoma belcheri]|nr:hypothetical protein Bbelb_267650 [Branchiostoma belcheri]